ncbi:hypothetical protein [Lentzea californiensis]|uniref:hypothetical protein n=1 Tax=Lentzea californiensis TaxID=438851 RepID=UPI002166560C|nr:hypothetical protein [Lentzea californiensis]MCR3752131.1 hypothetical protein [Lentzea californiensis]
MIHTRSPLPRNLDPPTPGVEEEFLIVDAATGFPLPVASEVIDVANGFGTGLQQEITRAQVESATPRSRAVGRGTPICCPIDESPR